MQPLQIRVPDDVIARLDGEAERIRSTVPGSKATRSSVAAYLLDAGSRSYPLTPLGTVAHGDPHTGTPAAPYPGRPRDGAPPVLPAPPGQTAVEQTDRARLLRALGSMAPGTLDRQLKIGKGTTLHVVKGSLSLAAAAKGRLLAWVVEVELRAAG